MSFEKRFKELIEKHPIPTDAKLWTQSSIYGLFVLIISLLYSLAAGDPFTTRTVNQVVGNVSFILIGISFILSSVCYFWNFADKYFIYRKHIGLVGFTYAVIHTALSIIATNRFAPFPKFFLTPDNIVPFVSAVIAMVIYTIMTAISNRYAIQELGGKNWRLALRTGYIAYIFTIIHAGLKAYPKWLDWFSGENILPPFSLIVICFATLVIVLRIALWISLMKKANQK